MDKLILQDVRCFRGRHEIPLAPLTLLVGENSTGKSTVLAAARLAWDIGKGVATPGFNEEPFDWGAYDQIACTRGGRGGRVKCFVIGGQLVFHSNISDDNSIIGVEARFDKKDAQPRIAEWRGTIGSSVFVVDMTKDTISLEMLDIGKRICWKRQRMFFTPGFSQVIGSLIVQNPAGILGEKVGKKVFEVRNSISHLDAYRRPYAFAPIRTRPKRTYDRRTDMPGPEGEHVPMVLAKLRSSNSAEWGELTAELSRFGSESGLFKDVNVKPLGKSSDPFQVQITISGPPSNLIDVGYGVSQVLPVLVDCLSETGKMYLMQQPEVHLHPKAQAQIGSFLGYLAVKQKKQFLVETHSDHLVDRVVMDVRDGKHGLKPKDVRILYFERKRNKVVVHPMEINESGNLIGAPLGYRRFFLDEEKRFIGG